MGRAAALLLMSIACLGIAQPVAAQRQHTVRPGQSLNRVARRYRIEVWDLALANRLRPGSMVRAGDTLVVPPRGVTYVRPGQTLSHVARANDCSVEELMRLNRLRRRSVRLGQRLVLPGYVEPSTRQRSWGAPSSPGVVRIRRRQEATELRLVDAEGRVTREGLEGLAGLMRRHESDLPAPPHPRLTAMLAAVSDHFGGREIILVSGRREAGGYTRESSRHTLGHAADVRVSGVPMRVLWDFCRTLSHTGCGYYPRSTFVHLDVRPRATQWVDWSRPGQRPRYGNLRGPWPRYCSSPRRRGHRRCRREGRGATTDRVPEEVVLTTAATDLLAASPEAEGDLVAAESEEAPDLSDLESDASDGENRPREAP